VELQAIKTATFAAIDLRKKDLAELALRLHDLAEVSFEEKRSAELLVQFLHRAGFSVTFPYGGLATAFRGDFGPRAAGATIAFIAEYDALPGLGHACGHNLIAGAAVGAALGLAAVMKEKDWPGRVAVIGTPAEEYGGGKALMLEKGAFSDVDVAFCFHASNAPAAGEALIALEQLTITFHGISGHAAFNPSQARDALAGLLIALDALNHLRPGPLRNVIVNSVITEGGQAPNLIPDRASARLEIRAVSSEELRQARQHLNRCVEAGALATETRAAIQSDGFYESNVILDSLVDLVRANGRGLGIEIGPGVPPSLQRPSSDQGNLSRRVPTVELTLPIAEKPLNLHTPEATQASRSEQGLAAMVLASKILAASALDLFFKPALLARVKEEFTGKRR